MARTRPQRTFAVQRQNASFYLPWWPPLQTRHYRFSSRNLNAKILLFTGRKGREKEETEQDALEEEAIKSTLSNGNPPNGFDYQRGRSMRMSRSQDFQASD